MSTFSPANLKAIRRERRFTQIQLAEAVGVNKNTVQIWEGVKHKHTPHGIPTSENFQKLCIVLGCEPEDLLHEQS